MEEDLTILKNNLSSEKLVTFQECLKVIYQLVCEMGLCLERAWGWECLLAPVAANCLSPTDTSSGSEDEGSVQGDPQGTPTSSQGSINMEHWISQAIHGSTTSTTSSSSTQSGGSGAAHRLADVMAQTHIGECPAAVGCAVLHVYASEWLLSVPTPFSLPFPRLCIMASESTRGTGQTLPLLLGCFAALALLFCETLGFYYFSHPRRLLQL